LNEEQVINLRYESKSIYDAKMYESARVMIVTGNNNVFNNIVIDKLRSMCKSDEDDEIDLRLASEFQISEFNSNGNTVDFNEFIEVVKSPSLSGKWFCSVNYSMLSAKQIEQLKNYSKQPSEYGVLVVCINEFKNYRSYLRDSIYRNSNVSHLMQLSFPTRSILKEIVRNMFDSRGMSISSQAIELFVSRMGNRYDDYAEIIDKIGLDREGTNISYDDMVTEMKGITAYQLDDFIVRLTEPIESTKIVPKRKIYTMEKELAKDMGVRKLVYSLKSRISCIIDMRQAINNGVVPVEVTYSVDEAKEILGKDSKLYSLNRYAFKKVADIASRTSMRDWLFMWLILDSVSDKSSDIGFEYAIYLLIHREHLDRYRLMNAIGITDKSMGDLYNLNRVVLGVD
jgi:hypothetical protein